MNKRSMKLLFGTLLAVPLMSMAAYAGLATSDPSGPNVIRQRVLSAVTVEGSQLTSCPCAVRADGKISTQ